MTAASILVRAAKDTAARTARQNGHSLAPWQHGNSLTWAPCITCGAEARVMRSTGSISGPALTAHCKVPETAGRAA